MAKIELFFYGALAQITKEKRVEVNGSTLNDVINRLTTKYGEQLKQRIYDEKGQLRRFINVYINGKDIRYLDRLNTKLKDGDKISVLPAAGGG